VKLLHFADLHLDASFRWLEPEPAARRRANRRATLTRILQLAEERNVDAVLCAGDLFEFERFSPDTVEFLRASFERSARRIFLAPGNHDWYGPRSPYATVAWPPNVHLFTETTLTPVSLADGVTVWGAAHRAPANTDGFFADFRPDRGGIHLALAHASERGALGWQDPGKQPHAPFDAGELDASGIQHAFLGHFHLPRDAAHYTYPGNPDPLEFGERDGRDGERRGAVLATLATDGTITRERHSVAVSAVHDITVRVERALHADDIRAELGTALAGLDGSARVTLTGELAPSIHLDLRELMRLGSHLDGFVLRTDGLQVGYDLSAVRAEGSVKGQFVLDAEAEIGDEERRRRVILTGLRALEGRADLDVA